MNSEQRWALEQVQASWAVSGDDIWSPVSHHVDGLHGRAEKAVLSAVERARSSAAGSPIGFVLQGERGVGKSHLLRWLRQQVQDSTYFFLVKFVEGTEFWRSVVHGVVESLDVGEGAQLGLLLGRLADIAELPAEPRQRVTGVITVTRAALEALVAGVRRAHPQVGAAAQDTLRALVLNRSRDLDLQDIGQGYLFLDGSVPEDAQRVWGFRRGAKPWQQIMRELSWLCAITGPSIVAVDQIDALVSMSNSTQTELGPRADRDVRIGEIADGLMELRETTRRTLAVVACLPGSWQSIQHNSVNSAADRFRVETLQSTMSDAAVARGIVAQYLQWTETGYDAPYDTWPVLPAAFSGPGVRTSTPRKLLQRVYAHVGHCLEAGEVDELGDLSADQPPPLISTGPDEPTLGRLDEVFARRRESVDVKAPLDHQSEDAVMPMLLAAGLHAYISEQDDDGQALSLDRIRGRNPAIHARLRRTLDEQTEDEVQYCLRAIAHSNDRAVQSRLRKSRTESGLRAGVDRRRLVLIRNTEWPKGPKTRSDLEEFNALGGLSIPIGEGDLRTFAALEEMRRTQEPGFQEWLVARRPAGSTELLRRVLGREESVPVPTGAPEPAGVPAEDLQPARQTGKPTPSPRPRPRPTPPLDAVPVGRSMATDHQLGVGLVALRKHTAVFAGSGSGKTVLLRRLVEECALRGVSAIVLDPNNDLARLGDAWPEPPPDWADGDAALAKQYLAETEVVVWTPGRSAGRPLTFQPLPEFGPIMDDVDEFRLAIDAAVASLSPRAGLTGSKAEQGAAVLRESLRYFARRGGRSLGAFIDFLDELPDGISRLRDGQKLASTMAQALHAAMINDPLFGGDGESVDPSALLRPDAAARARISVISFVGLPAAEQRQGFVNQLQMALFSWIKANPAGDRPLGGLFVMDEAQTFAPSGARTACTQSTISLASQARKYGLGLVFATQAPRGLHNQITGNASTQFFGFLNSPTQIAAAKDLARTKNGQVDDISQLRRGQFYVAREGATFVKVHEPMCLSHHPPSPLTEEEVLWRACADRA
jgi:hypothetical protein